MIEIEVEMETQLPAAEVAGAAAAGRRRRVRAEGGGGSFAVAELYMSGTSHICGRVHNHQGRAGGRMQCCCSPLHPRPAHLPVALLMRPRLSRQGTSRAKP